MRQAFDIYVDHDISFNDALHAVFVASSELKEIVSFEQGFDRVSGIRRIEP
jgi:predicted nucleic acid-binding protein